MGGVLLLLVVGGMAYFYLYYPKVEAAPVIEVSATAAQIERGEYLANHVALCIDCHSTRNWSVFAGPIIPGTEGKGGEKFGPEMGFPGTFYSKNITPHNLKNWTDGEIYRAITGGVSRDESPLFPVMPYPYYKSMDPRDVKAIIAYIRTLEPIENTTPDSEPAFPMNFIMRTIPAPYDPAAAKRPSPEDILEYGKYLVTISACSDCHTPKQKGQPVMEQYMAGGVEFDMSFGTVRSANITPHVATGIGTWTEDQFVATFKQYDVPIDSLPDPSRRGYNTIMPWQMYAGMKEQDLKAIFAYLQSLELRRNKVNRFAASQDNGQR